MLQALLHGKLSREQENMEDVLTSNVFGLLRYIPARDGLFPFLARAEGIDGSPPPLAHLLNDDLDFTVSAADFDFWPFYDEPDCKPCEPDVVIRVRNPHGRDLLILVEAKYLSGKSSEASETDQRPNDQLAREWDNLLRVAERENANPFLIYLTGSLGIPVSEIEASIAEYRSKRKDDASSPAILALSWRHIPEVFQQSNNVILRDLSDMAERFGFRYFHGFHLSSKHERWSWKFNPFPARWTRFHQSPKVRWRFCP